MNFEIAIPSYKRSITVVEKTLAYLQQTDVDMKKITIFVADKNELTDYKKSVKKIKLVVGKPTLRGQRNFMRHYYKPGKNVLFIDDDVVGLYLAVGKKHTQMLLVRTLVPVCHQMFGLCKQFDVGLWGVSAVPNPYFMFGKKLSTDLKYIIGAFYGQVIDHDKSQDVVLEDKEDFERTVKSFIKHGKVLRINDMAVKSNYYKEDGGMQVTRTKERVSQSAAYMVKHYPKYCKMNTGKQNQEFAEIKLIKQ